MTYTTATKIPQPTEAISAEDQALLNALNYFTERSVPKSTEVARRNVRG